jgi:hypothetical protein
MIRFDDKYKISKNVVTRKIEGETIIIPLVADVGNPDEELYTLNESGKLIWEHLNGHETLAAISEELAQQHGAPLESVQEDVLGFVSELADRKIVITVANEQDAAK